ncbi:hypothetical protein [Microcystis phage Mvi-JY20]|uniref:Virion structural protein n=1 Tax=Microcystis phage Mvi-JY20 TaxID=3128146 RepID=A0AAX4QG94_9CAUD
MSRRLSDYTVANLINALLGKAAFPVTSEAYLALFTATPANNGSPTNEVTGGSYARVSIKALMQTATVTPPNPATSGQTGTITFPTATANWGTITEVAICDALTGGNWLVKVAITPQVVNSGAIFELPIGTLSLFNAEVS